MKKINFTKGNWEDSLIYGYTYRWDVTPKVIQEEDCVVNAVNKEFEQGFENISLMTKEKYSAGTRITTTCSYEKAAAPLFVIADRYYEEDGLFRYGDYLEVVLYENGINVWRMYLKDRTVTYDLLMSNEFHVSESERHTFSVEMLEDAIRIEMEGRKMLLRIDNMYKDFHVGVNMCEGICKFYDFTIEDGK